MGQSLRARMGRPLMAVGLFATLVLTAAAEAPSLADPAVQAVVLGLVAIAVVALILVRRRRAKSVTPTAPTEDE